MRDRKYVEIALQIRDMIGEESLEAGTRLPTERIFAEKFGVTRATIRHAEIHLQAQGVLEIKPGSGVYVLDSQSASNDSLPEVTALELTQARSFLESEAAALAAVHITDQDLAKLSDCIESMNDALPDNQKIADVADGEFHLTIARASGNVVILHVVKMLWRMRNEIESVKRMYDAVCTDDTVPRGQEHSEILDTLIQHDPMAARIAMRAHFSRIMESMLDVSTTQAIEEVHRRADEERQQFLMIPALVNRIAQNR